MDRRTKNELDDLETLLRRRLTVAPQGNIYNTVTPTLGTVTPLVINAATDQSGNLLIVQSGTAQLVGVSSTGQVVLNPSVVAAPLVLGPNALNQLVTGLNADLLDGADGTVYLTTIPAYPTRNLVFCGSSITPILAGVAYPGQTYRLIQIVDSSIAEIFAVTHDGSLVIAPNAGVSPINLGANATGRLVTGLNSDLLDGYHASAFRLTGTAISHGSLSGLTLDEHFQYLHIEPDSSDRNKIEPPDDFVHLTLKAYAGGQSENYLQAVDATDNPLFYVTANFKAYALGLDAGNEKITAVANPTLSGDAVNLGYLQANYSTGSSGGLVYTGSTATGTILVGSGSGFTGLPIGSNDQVLAVTGSSLAYKTPDNSWSYWYGFERRPIQAAVTGGAFTLAVADASLANATDEDGFTMGRTAADGNITYLAFQFACPDDLDTTQAVNAMVYCRLAGAGSNQIEFKSRVRAVDRDEGLLAGGTYRESSNTLSLAGYSADDLALVSISNVFTAGELSNLNRQLIKGSIVRDATAGNANDTYAASVIVIGVKFYGSRKRYE